MLEVRGARGAARASAPVAARALAAACLVAPLVVAAARPASSAHTRREAQAPLSFERYRDQAGVALVLSNWVSSGQAERVAFESTAGGREVVAIEFGPGLGLAVDRRRTVFLVGALDGRSQAGAEAVLAACERLLAEDDELPPDLAVIALPLGSPDGLAGLGSSRAVDHDRDGALNEDGPDDLDGDGFVVEMLIEDANGDLARDDGSRVVRRAGPGDLVRLVRAPEGRDDDGDGLFNEDGVPALDLDSTFPLGASSTSALREPPLSNPLARRLADLVFERRTVAVLLFQGAHGGLARPGGSAVVPWEASQDAVWFDRLAARFEACTGRRQGRAWTLEEAWAEERPGAFLDWCFAVPGVPAVEVSAWGPQVALGDFGQTLPAPLSAGERERLWSRWLDDARAGLGFVAWHAIELGGERRAWVGGWQPRTIVDPPERQLTASLSGLGDFARSTIEALPALELSVRTVRRAEGVVSVAVSVVNRGELPTGYSTTGRHAERERGDVLLELHAVAGARLLSGSPLVRLPALGGGARSETIEWLIFAPRGTRVSVTAATPFCTSVEREVRL